jgi:hypothetical protein
MQRQFSNRGEALAEVTAARMLARRKRCAGSAFTTQGGRQGKAERWFTKPAEVTQHPKVKPPKHDADVTPLL